MSVSQVLKQLQTWCSADPIILRKMVKNIVEILRTRRTEEEIPAIITDLSAGIVFFSYSQLLSGK